ncbi:hypothetical protein PIB30_032099 [Stylosanthes scabra]|uniref:Uncharacterized protein n=1 Tax=Stylosanthes scabra TaxID=79078 RepID=A0ABU6TBQ6_9FABA|nr:hypothetical protein [Stylosanthes scabra]
MAQPTLEEIAAADKNIMYRLDSIAHVSRNVNRESIRSLSTVRRQQPMYLDPRAEPYLERVGLLPLARLCDAWFKVDEPEFDGSTRLSQMDLNEPVSAPSQIFMAQAGTPPSAYMPDPYVIVSDPAAARQPEDNPMANSNADDGGAPRGRGRRVPRRRACGTGGHM